MGRVALRECIVATVLGMKDERVAALCQKVFPCIYIHYLE